MESLPDEQAVNTVAPDRLTILIIANKLNLFIPYLLLN
jgi:hypothetical protein